MRRALAFMAFLAIATGCVGAEDNPTQVHDLRVLAVKLEPPELLLNSCTDLMSALLTLSSPVQYTALIADPKGEGRSLHYELFACASTGDRICENADERALLASGDVAPTSPSNWLELGLSIRPGVAQMPDRSPLIFRVLELDTYGGLGGLRMPLVLHLTAGEEEIYAQKLMVFTCKNERIPNLRQNINPELPGMLLNGEPWGQGDVPLLKGPGPFAVAPVDFVERQESYVVLTFELSELQLVESWRLSYYADVGSFSPGGTGGTDFGGTEGRHFTEWRPSRRSTEQDVRFWFVARDGRGGTTWLTRTAHYQP